LLEDLFRLLDRDAVALGRDPHERLAAALEVGRVLGVALGRRQGEPRFGPQAVELGVLGRGREPGIADGVGADG
jgi:hypothetical protein